YDEKQKIILTPRLAQRTKAIDPKYAAVNGNLSLDINALICAAGPFRSAKLKYSPHIVKICVSYHANSSAYLKLHPNPVALSLSTRIIPLWGNENSHRRRT